jgi:hypothetical protein
MAIKGFSNELKYACGYMLNLAHHIQGLYGAFFKLCSVLPRGIGNVDLTLT